MTILLWILFGALAGWIATIVMGTDARTGAIGNIILGILGAVIGGFLLNILGAPGVSGFNLYSLAVSIVGAVVLIWFGRLLYR